MFILLQHIKRAGRTPIELEYSKLDLLQKGHFVKKFDTSLNMYFFDLSKNYETNDEANIPFLINEKGLNSGRKFIRLE